jgi:purine-nucleoside phosphorylase
VLFARGRFHYYEGYSLEEVTYPQKVFAELKIRQIILTNAAGCINPGFHPGDFMGIVNHINFVFPHSSTTNQDPWDSGLLKKAASISEKHNIPVRWGTYAWTIGPSYETPAEIHLLYALGADAVGMSTVPEAVEAHRLGMKVLGISLLTNYAAGISMKPLSHKEVMKMGEQSREQFTRFIKLIVEE